MKGYKLHFILSVFLSCIVFIVKSQDINDGLIAQYEFNGNANDNIGSNHGILSGVSEAKDRFNNVNSAYLFDGLNDYIEIPDNDLMDFEFDEDFTISLWVNIAAIQNDLGGTNNDIIGKWNSLRSMPYPYAIRYWNINATEERKNKIFSLRYDSETCNHNPLITGECYIATEQWHHLVFIKRGNILEYYQDNMLFGSATDNTISQCNTINNNRLLIGKRTLGGRYFAGLIDDISFYNRALSTNEIELLYKLNNWTSPVEEEMSILSFKLPYQLGPTIIDKINRTIDVIVSCNSDLDDVIAIFSVSKSGFEVPVNEEIQLSGITSNNFSNTIVYTLRDYKNCIDLDWTINVYSITFEQEEIDNSIQIQEFSIPTQIGQTDINRNDFSIKVTVPCETDLNNLKASFLLPLGTYVFVNDVQQVSAQTNNSFSNFLTYKVSSSHTCVDQEWTIYVLTQKLDLELLNLSDPISIIPNIITPNGDDYNEMFELGELFLGSEVTIFNRHGIEVYQNINYKNEFNGSFLASGQYYYHIKSNCFEFPIKGYLRILK